MKPNIKDLLTILYVANQERSKQFYSALFDCEPRLNVPGMTEFNLGNKIYIGLMPEDGIAKIICPTMPHPKQGSGIPRCELYLRVNDPQQYLERAIKLGATKISNVEPRNWGDDVAYVADLDGNILAFAKVSI